MWSTIVLAAVTGVVLGGRLGYVAVLRRRGYWSDPCASSRMWDGGMSFHGGLAGVLVGGLIVARMLGMPLLTLCDSARSPRRSVSCFGRLANFVNGELWGRVDDVAVGASSSPGGHCLVTLRSSTRPLLEGVVLFVDHVAARGDCRHAPTASSFGWLLALYGTFRIVVEFFREPDAQSASSPGGVTMGKVLSVPMSCRRVAAVGGPRRSAVATARSGRERLIRSVRAQMHVGAASSTGRRARDSARLAGLERLEGGLQCAQKKRGNSPTRSFRSGSWYGVGPGISIMWSR